MRGRLWNCGVACRASGQAPPDRAAGTLTISAPTAASPASAASAASTRLVDAELGQDGADVVLDGLGGQDEPFGRSRTFVRPATDEVQHLAPGGG